MRVTGFVRLARRLRDHWLWSEEPLCQSAAWVDLVMEASFADGWVLWKGNRVEVHRGEIVTTERELAGRWQWSRSRVRRWLKRLEDEGMITRRIAKKGCGKLKPTIVALTNYDKWNGKSKSDGDQGHEEYTNTVTDSTPAGSANKLRAHRSSGDPGTDPVKHPVVIDESRHSRTTIRPRTSSGMQPVAVFVAAIKK